MKKTKTKWFKPLRGSYLPISWQGWFLYIIFVSYLVSAACVIHKNSTSAAFVAIQTFGQWVLATIVMTWIAQRTS